jgi:hypothetical protein
MNGGTVGIRPPNQAQIMAWSNDDRMDYRQWDSEKITAYNAIWRA